MFSIKIFSIQLSLSASSYHKKASGSKEPQTYSIVPVNVLLLYGKEDKRYTIAISP